jgi:hypothetical protein
VQAVQDSSVALLQVSAVQFAIAVQPHVRSAVAVHAAVS